MANTPFFNRYGLNVNNQISVLASNGYVTSGANVGVGVNTIAVGNSTVNSSINSSALSLNDTLVGNTSMLLFGNSTVNTTINSTAMAVNGSVGSNGQYLQSNGTTMSWSSPSVSDALVLLGTMTASNSVILENNTAFSDTYDDYMILVRLRPSTNSTTLGIRLGNSTAFFTSNYCNRYDSAGGAGSQYNNFMVPDWDGMDTVSTSDYFQGVLYLHAVNAQTATNAVKYISGGFGYANGDNSGYVFGGVGCAYAGSNTTKIRGIQFGFYDSNFNFATTYNINEGVVKIYGIKKA